MKLRTQFLTILIFAFGSLSVLLFIGRQRLSDAVADTELIVDKQFNPLVLENAPRLLDTYKGLTALLFTIRHANQARMAQIKSLSPTNSQEEIRRLVDNTTQSLLNMEATIQAVSKTFPEALKKDWLAQKGIVDGWIAEERQLIRLTEALADDISKRARFHEKSELSFSPFRASIDVLGEHVDALLASSADSPSLSGLGKSISLILNADRDSYQARMAEQRLVLYLESDPLQHQATNEEYSENMGQIEKRLDEAESLLGPAGTLEFQSVRDLYAIWADNSAAAVTVSNEIFDKLVQRETHIKNANALFAQSQSWLESTHSQLQEIAKDELRSFETARDQARKTSDNIRETARSYLGLFNGLAILAFVCFLVLLFFQRRLFLNLMGLSEYLSELDEEKLSTPYKMPPQRILPVIELTQLSQNLNAMRERLVQIIGDHKNALKRLSRSEARFSSLFYNTVSPILLADPKSGKIVDANQAAAILYQRSLDDLRSSKLSQLDASTASTGQTLSSKISQLSVDQSQQFETLQQKADHSAFTAQIHAGLVEIEQNLHALIMIDDVSERVEYQQQILIAKEAAESANRTKDEFLSVISHELRTPLNPIIGYAQLLEIDPTSQAVSQFSRSILGAANNMLSLIERMLQFTQLNETEDEPNWEAFTIETLLQPAIDFARAKAAPDQVAFRNGTDTFQALYPGSKIQGPKSNIVQVLQILLENAVKYAKGATIEVTVGCAQSETPASLHIGVVDQGGGVPEGFRSKLFSAFSQADSSFTRAHEGIGLGLAICQKLTTQARGKIAYEPNHPTGSRFLASFPIEIDKTVHAGHELGKASPASPQAAATNAKVLIVEDNPENAAYLSYVLDRLGMHVDSVTDGPQAIEKALNKTYDAALIDISLQGMDGLEILERLHQIPGYKNQTKSIAVTAHVSSSVREKCLAHGFDDFLTKPVTPIQLEASLARQIAPGR